MYVIVHHLYFVYLYVKVYILCFIFCTLLYLSVMLDVTFSLGSNSFSLVLGYSAHVIRAR